MTGPQGNGDQVLDAIKEAFKSAAKAARKGAGQAVKVAKVIADPVGEYERHEEKKRLESNRQKLESTMARQKTGPQAHVLSGQGPLGTDTVVVDKGTTFGAEAAAVGDDGSPFWDVVGNSLALINTREHIESFFAAHADARLVNSNVFAEIGHEIHALMVDSPGVKIGAAVSVFRPLSEKDRYEVINPIMAAVKLIGPRLADLGGAAAGAAAKAAGAAALNPNEVAENAKGAVEMAGGLLGNAADAKELVHPGGGGELSDKPIFIITFSETGFAPTGKGIKSKTATFACERVGNKWGVRIGTISGELLGLIDGLSG